MIDQEDEKHASSKHETDKRRDDRLVWLFCLLTVVFLAISGASFTFHDSDVKNCRMSYMSPSYTPLNFDSSSYNYNYRLYWYREKGKDTDLLPKGQPVLFIPGNAGSFRQVRAIAAEAANQKLLQQLSSESSLDFFTADFNEDLAAFSGRALLNQAEYLNEAIDYILGLYSSETFSESSPKSIILMGHSMGGMVAKTIVTLKSYTPGKVKTIFTLAAPLSSPPLSMDQTLVDTYDKVNYQWEVGMKSNGTRYVDVAVISVAGGGLDRMIPSELTNALVPSSHGFTVYTSTVPYVWSAIDHQAIVWCDQFRAVIAKSLLESVGKPLTGRVDVFRNYLLSGFEDDSELRLPRGQRTSLTSSTNLLIYNKDNVEIGSQVEIQTGVSDQPTVKLVPVTTGTRVGILTDKTMKDDVYVMKCERYSKSRISTSKRVVAIDASNSSTGTSNGGLLLCYDLSGTANVLPKASSNMALAAPSDKEHFYYVDYESDSGGYVAIVEAKSGNPGLVMAQTLHASPKVVTDGLMRLSLGKKVKLDRQIVNTVTIDSVWSSLIAVEVTVAARGGNHTRVQPFMRQFITEPYESKYFLNVGDETLRVQNHGVAPFVPFDRYPKLSLQVWSDEEVQLSIKIDWLASAGRLVLHYRSALAVFPLAVTIMVVILQTMGSFSVSFDEAFRLFIHRYLGLVVLSVVALPSALKNPVVQQVFEWIEPTHNGPTDLATNRYFLGLEGTQLWFLGPVFVVVSTVLSFGLSLAVEFVLYITSCVCEGLPCLQNITFPVVLSLATCMFMVPYQVVMVGACAVQLINASIYKNYYQSTLLVLLLSVLPISIPTAAIWVAKPQLELFSVENIISIAPILLILVHGPSKLPPPLRLKPITVVVMLYICIYTFIFGIQRAYNLHHLVNMFCGWLVFVSRI